MPATDQAPYIGLALSGGGARAMAFHLGCLRALNDRKILDQVKVISTVSGGSVIGACWAYRGESFEEFDRHIVGILRHGLQWHIVRSVFLSLEGPKILATLAVTGTLTLLIGVLNFVLSRGRRWLGIPTVRVEAWLSKLASRLPIWGSLTTAFETALDRNLFGGRTIDQVQRPNLSAIINACELTTGTAFRFGSDHSGGWRYGTITGPLPSVAKAVAASAAFPILLPPLVEAFDFDDQGRQRRATVSLIDGGVYDNLGVAVLEPGRFDESILRYPVTHLISLNAGGGQYTGSDDRHFWWAGRVAQSFSAVHRKSQDAIYQRLHKHADLGELAAFGMVYLGQQDHKLHSSPPDLVRREQVKDYPTDFAPMSARNLALLTRRGEQLTHLIVDTYLNRLGS